ncbi:MAG: AarF/ABC1/UbiB kinase family protein [Sphingobacteriales bacterium]|nr:AarF/ABC1/UbiB kinase family protein [Sphingobacteriales bacterium]
MIFGKTIQNLKRTREILGVLLKYGLEDLVSNTSLQNLITKNRKLKWLRDDKPILDYTRWERIRLACEDLGPTFIKFGQVLSNRPDLLPDDFIIELQKLQSEVPPFPFNQVKSIIEEELKLPLADIFSQFDEKPVGSASIGQVHKAILADGRQVVVKVRRPGVAKRVRTDLLIIRDLVNRAEHILERNGIVNAIDAVDAFERSIQKELDYTNEARNISTFKHAYRNYKKFYVPSVYKEFSTSKVLVMEFVDGCKITDVVQLAAWGLDPPLLAEMGMDIYLTQIFEHGFFHADPTLQYYYN